MPIRRVHKMWVAASLASAIALGVSACGASSLSASSSCQDFMHASPVEQHEIVDQLATQYQKPEYSTPLGEPEVPYYCSANPSTSLADFFTNAED